jgi:RNase H-fold protein (predicted Holliday junction resolvase)
LCSEPTISEEVVLAIDPGSSKVGLAVVQSDGRVLYRAVLAVAGFDRELLSLHKRFHPRCIVVGSGTGFRAMEKRLREMLPDVPLQVVDEAYTSEQARRRYLLENPPTGWRKLIPAWLRTPDKPYDDYVAVILAERYWQQISQVKVES